MKNTIVDKRTAVITDMRAIAEESFRVAHIAHNSEKILNSLDREFESITGLNESDVRLLFVATALQVLRIVVTNWMTIREKAGNDNRNETIIHEIQELIMKGFKGDDSEEQPYQASLNHIICTVNVPYDTTNYLNENLGLFKGANHRFSTLGHDPLLGLIFGTGNIITNTITCVKKLDAPVEVPLITTNHVKYDSEYKNPKIASYGSTIVMLKSGINREKNVIVASIIKQILHIGTDIYTPLGIQLPGTNLVLSNSEVQRITGYIDTGDILMIGANNKLAEFINMIISTLHVLMYDDVLDYNRSIYNVRTRKIITYSNEIATGSNLLLNGIRILAGNNISVIKQLDIGGLLMLIKRIAWDKQFVRDLKEEFIIEEFNKKIRG